MKERRQCILCRLGIEPDYKNVRLLSQFQSRYTGRIYDKHITGLCEHKQKRVEEEILKAQNAGACNVSFCFSERNVNTRRATSNYFFSHYRFNGLYD